MNDTKSAKVIATLSESLAVDELPFNSRSDKWWNEFWRVMGLKRAQMIRRMYENQA